MSKVLHCFILFILIESKIIAQNNVLNIYENDQVLLSELEIQSSHLFNSHSAIKPYQQEKILASEAFQDQKKINRIHQLNYDYYSCTNDSIAQIIKERKKTKPLLTYFNTYPSHFFSSYSNDYYFTLDPLLQFSIGNESSSNQKLLKNSRGIRLLAGIDKKVFIHSEFTENQLSLLSYEQDFANTYKSIPGAGFVKSYSSKFFKINQGYDYIIAEGGINFKVSKHIDIEFAHGRNFLGQGIRSLLLSDFSAPQFFLKINSQFGRFNYVNIFSELSAENRFVGDVDQLLQKKYSASHYLSMNVGKNWNVALFESVIFHRNKTFELQYLNPIILYRAVEQALGSPDNVLLGIQSHVKISKKVLVYGQLLLDEFVLDRVIIKNEGWWANKYGFQLGFKYPKVLGVKGLYLQLETNVVRPFTYSYSDSLTNYSHFHQPLAHPLSSNFKELLTRVQYDLNDKNIFVLSVMNYSKGLDLDSTNFGGNLLKNNSTRVTDYHNSIGQGLNTKVNHIELRYSYELFARTFLDFNVGIRTTRNSLIDKNSKWFTFGIRMNMNNRINLF